MEYEVYSGKNEGLSFFFAQNRQILINTINPHSYCEAKKDKVFHEALLNSDLLLPDGYGISLAEKFLYGEKLDQYTGPMMHMDILTKADKEGLKVFYLGSNAKTLNMIRKRIGDEYPNIKQIGIYSPPFKPEFTTEDNVAMIHAVNDFRPDFLFIGMTAPKQEKWGFLHRADLQAQVICAIGAAFDFFAGTIPLAPQWMIRWHLIWLYRLYKEPKRMWRRNFISTPRFLIDIFMYKCNFNQ